MANCRNNQPVLWRLLRTALGAGAGWLLLSAASQAQAPNKPWQESYTSAQEVEQVYGGAKDVISLDAARQLMLQLVNDERAKRKFSQLKPLAQADTLAQQHAGEMAQQHYASHYSLSGLKCEGRWNAMGQTDQVAENMAYYEIDHHIYLTPQLVRRMHQHWMDSESHRVNLLDPHHTHMGCGFGLAYANGRSYVTGVEEFIADYGVCDRLPRQAAPGDTISVHGTLDPQHAVLRFIGLGSEDLPFTRTVEYQMSHIGGYSPPDVALALVPTQYRGRWSPRVDVSRYEVKYDGWSGEYSVSFDIKPQWPPGAYYISAWASEPGNSDAVFCVMTQVLLVKPRT
jgi:uncharacterized protein YkwD